MQVRVSQFFERLETEIRQLFREAFAWQSESTIEQRLGVNPGAALLIDIIEGRLHRFVRDRFQRSPLEGWDEEWKLIRALFSQRSLF